MNNCTLQICIWAAAAADDDYDSVEDDDVDDDDDNDDDDDDNGDDSHDVALQMFAWTGRCTISRQTMTNYWTWW